MSLETTVQNLAVEVRHRMTSAQRRDDAERKAVRALAGKIAVGAWILAGNLFRAAGGNRVGRQRFAIHSLQAGLQNSDEAHLLATLDHAVEVIHWQLACARRSSTARRSEQMITDFVEATEVDLARLSKLLKG